MHYHYDKANLMSFIALKLYLTYKFTPLPKLIFFLKKTIFGGANGTQAP